MQEEQIELTRGLAAPIIKLFMAKNRISERAIAAEIGIYRQLVGYYLRRNIDLLPRDINKIFRALNLNYYVQN